MFVEALIKNSQDICEARGLVALKPENFVAIFYRFQKLDLLIGSFPNGLSMRGEIKPGHGARQGIENLIAGDRQLLPSQRLIGI